MTMTVLHLLLLQLLLLLVLLHLSNYIHLQRLSPLLIFLEENFKQPPPCLYYVSSLALTAAYALCCFVMQQPCSSHVQSLMTLQNENCTHVHNLKQTKKICYMFCTHLLQTTAIKTEVLQSQCMLLNPSYFTLLITISLSLSLSLSHARARTHTHIYANPYQHANTPQNTCIEICCCSVLI